MPLTPNGYSADPDPSVTGIVPFIINGVAFGGGVRGGAVHTVLSYVAQQLHARVEPARADLGCYGWNYRANVNDPTVLSNHSSGTAIDYNSEAHPNATATTQTWTPVQIAEIGLILAEVDGAVRWGGDYESTPDPMHFEINVNEATLETIAAGLPEGGGSAVALPITHLESSIDPDVDPAPLTDDDVATYVALNSGAAADWFADFDSTALTGATAFAIMMTLDVISRGAPFVVRATLTDATGDWIIQGTVDLADGPNSVSVTIDSAFMTNAWPAAPWNWNYLGGGSPAGTYEELRAAFATGTPRLHIQGYDGSPYVVHISKVQILTGGGGTGGTTTRIWYIPNDQILECWDSEAGILRALVCGGDAVQAFKPGAEPIGGFGSMFELGDGSLLVGVTIAAVPGDPQLALKVDSETLAPLALMTLSNNAYWSTGTQGFTDYEYVGGAPDGAGTAWTAYTTNSPNTPAWVFTGMADDLSIVDGRVDSSAIAAGDDILGTNAPSNLSIQGTGPWLWRNSPNDDFVMKYNLDTDELLGATCGDGERFLGVDDVTGMAVYVRRFAPNAGWVELRDVDGGTWVTPTGSGGGDVGAALATYDPDPGDGSTYTYFSLGTLASYPARVQDGKLYYLGFVAGESTLMAMDLANGTVEALGAVPYRSYDGNGNEAVYPDYIADNGPSDAAGLLVRGGIGSGGGELPVVVAEFSYQATPQGIIVFDGSPSTASEGDEVVTWAWEFNDLETDSLYLQEQPIEGEVVEHQFTVTPHTYEVTLTVTTQLGFASAVTHEVFVPTPKISGRVGNVRQNLS